MNVSRLIAPVLLVLVPAWPSAVTPVVRAGGPGTQDTCTSPLPPQLTFTGGNTGVFTLRGQGVTLTIAQFGPRGLTDEVQRLGYPSLRGDAVGEFVLQTQTPHHLYAGPLHVFSLSGGSHVCRSGAVQINATGNTTEQTNPYGIDLRIDGTIAGRKVRATVWVAGKRYSVSGSRSL